MSKPKAKNSSRNKNKIKRLSTSSYIFSAKILFFIGVLFLAIYIIYHAHYLALLSFRHTPTPAPIYTSASKPVQITISRLNIDLPIFETIIADNFWEIASDGASHLATSGRPGENNTSILYAHNTNDRFGPLLWIEKGDEIKIKTSDEKEYAYIVTDNQTVDPNQTKILTSQKGETLVLYTCTGFADLKRYVVIAKPQSTKISNIESSQ
ncbi:MAG: sortase [Candidatus Levybacteria bacterium]|nr:sortase [Candidatus Levybacteria bacterium]